MAADTQLSFPKTDKFFLAHYQKINYGPCQELIPLHCDNTSNPYSALRACPPLRAPPQSATKKIMFPYYYATPILPILMYNCHPTQLKTGQVPFRKGHVSLQCSAWWRESEMSFLSSSQRGGFNTWVSLMSPSMKYGRFGKSNPRENFWSNQQDLS